MSLQNNLKLKPHEVCSLKDIALGSTRISSRVAAQVLLALHKGASYSQAAQEAVELTGCKCSRQNAYEIRKRFEERGRLDAAMFDKNRGKKAKTRSKNGSACA